MLFEDNLPHTDVKYLVSWLMTTNGMFILILIYNAHFLGPLNFTIFEGTDILDADLRQSMSAAMSNSMSELYVCMWSVFLCSIEYFSTSI